MQARCSTWSTCRSRVVFHAVIVASVYLLFAGHNQPGGGFVGGLVAGAAIALRYVAGGIDEVRGLVAGRPWTILGAGVAARRRSPRPLPVLVGRPARWRPNVADLDLPVFGDVQPSRRRWSFDVGVYLRRGRPGADGVRGLRRRRDQPAATGGGRA